MSTVTDWAIPSELSAKGQEAAAVIVEFLKKHDMSDPLGGGRFYTPDEWDERGEQYGLGSLLIITHDGGEHAPAFNWDYEAYDLIEELRQELLKIGVYVEQCTSWFSAVYSIRSAEEPWVIVNRNTGTEVVDGVLLATDAEAALALAVKRKLIPATENHAAYRP